jgi:hypothetical protein
MVSTNSAEAVVQYRPTPSVDDLRDLDEVTIEAGPEASWKTRQWLGRGSHTYRISRISYLPHLEGRLCLHLAGTMGRTSWIPVDEVLFLD